MMQEQSISDEYIVGYITGNYHDFIQAGSEEEAEKIATILVEANLIACSNIIPAINSIYKWEGKLNVSIVLNRLIKNL